MADVITYLVTSVCLSVCNALLFESTDLKESSFHDFWFAGTASESLGCLYMKVVGSRSQERTRSFAIADRLCKCCTVLKSVQVNNSHSVLCYCLQSQTGNDYQLDRLKVKDFTCSLHHDFICGNTRP